MKLGRDIALMSMGAIGVLLYQKYSDCAMEKVEEVVKNTTKKINNKLENMS